MLHVAAHTTTDDGVSLTADEAMTRTLDEEQFWASRTAVRVRSFTARETSARGSYYDRAPQRVHHGHGQTVA